MRIHGRGGIVYMSVHAGDTPTQLAFLSDWSVNYSRQVMDVTPITEGQARYLASIVGCDGDFSGFYDNATTQTYLAALDGLPRDFVLYPATGNQGNFSGQILPDFAVTGAVGAAVGIKVTWTSVNGIVLIRVPATTVRPAAATVGAVAPAATVGTPAQARPGAATVNAVANVTQSALTAKPAPATVLATTPQATVSTGGARAGVAAVSAVAPTQRAGAVVYAGVATTSSGDSYSPVYTTLYLGEQTSVVAPQPTVSASSGTHALAGVAAVTAVAVGGGGPVSDETDTAINSENGLTIQAEGGLKAAVGARAGAAGVSGVAARPTVDVGMHAWSLAQQVTGSNAAQANTPAISMTTSTGSLLVAFFSRSGGSGTGALTSVTDSAGNTWTAGPKGAVSGATNTRIECWYCINATAITSLQGNSGTSQDWAWNVQEWAGASTVTIDVASSTYSGVASSTTIATPSITTTGSTDLVLAAGSWGQQSETFSGTGWTELTDFDFSTTRSSRAAYNAGSSNAGAGAGSYSVTWTLGAAKNAGVLTVSFKGTL